MTDHLHTSELLLVLGGSISAVFSGFVVITGLVFSKTMLSRTHPFSNIIFFISLCDFMGSVANCLGFPNRDSTNCHAQSFMLFFFFPASWLWTTALVYQLRSMILYKKLHVSMFTVHCICWSIALCVALLPLSEDDYGQDDDMIGRSVCILQSSDKRRKYQWMFVLFYGVLILCISLMTYWMIQAAYHIRAVRAIAYTDYKERKIYKATRWYPVGLLVTWALSLVVAMLLAVDGHVAVSLIQAGQISRTQYGTLLAIIFFGNSKIVRHRWKELFYPYVRKNLSTATDHLRQTSVAEDFDPEGEKFSDTSSFSDGPRFSDLTSIFINGLNFGNKTQTNEDSTNSSTNGSVNGSANDNTDEENNKEIPRTSFFVRDWLVTKSRTNSALEIEMSSTSTSFSETSGINGMGGSVGGSVVSPLATAIEKARVERSVGGVSSVGSVGGGVTSGSGGGSLKSSPITARKQTTSTGTTNITTAGATNTSDTSTTVHSNDTTTTATTKTEEFTEVEV